MTFFVIDSFVWTVFVFFGEVTENVCTIFDIVSSGYFMFAALLSMFQRMKDAGFRRILLSLSDWL